MTDVLSNFHTIPGSVKWLNRSLTREASGDDPRRQLVGMVRRRLWVVSRHPGSAIARVRLRWLGEVRQMSAIGTEEMIELRQWVVGLLG